METALKQFTNDLSSTVRQLKSKGHTSSQIVDLFERRSSLKQASYYKFLNGKSLPKPEQVKKVYQFIYDDEAYNEWELPEVIQEYLCTGRKNQYTSPSKILSRDVTEVLLLSNAHREIYYLTICEENYAPTIQELEIKYGSERAKRAVHDLIKVGAVVIKKNHLIAGKKRADMNIELFEKAIADNIYALKKPDSHYGEDRYRSKKWAMSTLTLSEDEVEIVNDIIDEAFKKINQIAKDSRGSKIFNIALTGRVINEQD